MLTRIIFTLFSLLIFLGCGSEDSTTSFTQNNPYAYYGPVTFDYYEIANDTILNTAINTDYSNVVYIINTTNTSSLAGLVRFVSDYNITNAALDINITMIDVLLENKASIDTTRTSQYTSIKDYGSFELKFNFCIVESSTLGCETYVYVRH